MGILSNRGKKKIRSLKSGNKLEPRGFPTSNEDSKSQKKRVTHSLLCRAARSKKCGRREGGREQYAFLE